MKITKQTKTEKRQNERREKERMEGKKDIRKRVLFQLAFSKFSKFLILNV